MRRQIILGPLVVINTLILFAALSVAAIAQSYPSKPITVVFGGGTGSPVENAFRMIAVEASKMLGQPLIWEGRPGANNRLAIHALLKAPADGYLLAMATDAVLISQPLLDPEFQMQVGKHYLPVAFMMEFPSVLVMHPSVGIKDLGRLISYAKANPGKLNFAASVGGSAFFTTVRFRQTTGIEFTLVPYKGSPQAMVDLVAGEVHAQFAPISAKQFVSSGRLVGIATTGSTRWNSFPNLPTLTERGVSMTSTFWFGLIAPIGTPVEVIARLNKTFNFALSLPEIRNKLDTDYGMGTGKYAAPEEFAAFIRAETSAWEPSIKSTGIKLQ